MFIFWVSFSILAGIVCLQAIVVLKLVFRIGELTVNNRRAEIRLLHLEKEYKYLRDRYDA